MLKPCLTCGEVSPGTRCPRHRHEISRRRDAARKARGVPVGSQRMKASTRKAVLRRDAWTCVYCGAVADTVDHVVPLARGGGSALENLVAACRSCNSRKGAK